MVCSGLPGRIDYHANEIACMALDFLSAVRSFVIDHLPDMQLQLRVGTAAVLIFIDNERQIELDILNFLCTRYQEIEDIAYSYTKLESLSRRLLTLVPFFV